MPQKHPIAIALAAIFACILWSSAFAAIKIALKYCSPISLAGIRFIISGLALVPFWLLLVKSPFQEIKDNLKTLLVLGIIQTFLLYLFFNIGMTMVSGAIASIVVGSSPLITAIVAHFTMEHDKITWNKTISFCIGFSGIILITISRKPFTAENLSALFGIILLLLASVSSALGSIVVAKNKKQINPLLMNSIQILFGGVILLLVGIIFEGIPDFNQPLEFYYALTWLAALSASAFSLWFLLLKQPGVQPSELNLWKFVIPVFGTLFSWLLLKGEVITFKIIIGMLLVATSVLCYYLPLGKKKLAK